MIYRLYSRLYVQREYGVVRKGEERSNILSQEVEGGSSRRERDSVRYKNNKKRGIAE